MPQASLRRVEAGKFYILNLDSPSGGGTHWVLCSALGGQLAYYDPFGVPPDATIIKAFRGTRKEPPIRYNTVDYQALNQSDCGERCLAEADKLLQQSQGSKKKPKVLVGTGMPIQLF